MPWHLIVHDVALLGGTFGFIAAWSLTMLYVADHCRKPSDEPVRHGRNAA